MTESSIPKWLEVAIEDPERPMILDCYSAENAHYVNARTKVTLKCQKHGEFEILPRDIQRRSYLCPECRDAFKKASKTTKRQSLVDRIEARFPGQFDLSAVVYVDSQTPVELMCKTHQTCHHLHPFDLEKRTYICTDCRDEALRATNTPPVTEFVRKAKKVHGDRYDYHQVAYHNASTKVVIVCPDHGPFEQAPRSHLSGRGCPKCGRASMADSKRKPDTDVNEPDA